MIRILIVDRNQIIRSSLRQIITVQCNGRVIIEANDTEQMFDILSKQDINFILFDIDIDIAKSNALDVLKKIKNLYPAMSILILSIHQEIQYVTSSIKTGANGYLLKTNIANEADIAVKKLIEGERYISPYFNEKLNNINNI